MRSPDPRKASWKAYCLISQAYIDLIYLRGRHFEAAEKKAAGKSCELRLRRAMMVLGKVRLSEQNRTNKRSG